MAPPKDMVPVLMHGLFNWIDENKKDLGLLTLSCIFHYELVFIYPFQDGNGRTAGFWQKVILGRFDPIFYELPIEKYILNNRSEYYKTIEKCNYDVDLTIFLKFILGTIKDALKDAKN